MNVILQATEAEPEVVELDRNEGRRFFDQMTRQALDMSGEEFVARYDRGEFASREQEEDSRVLRLIMLLPFWRDVPPPKP